jgi:branched-chain amino acid transport system ATP-binding protein
MTNGSALVVEGVSAGYGEVPVLRDVSLEVPPASAVALLGPNGVGKTTLLKTVAGFIKPTQGRVLFGGEDVTGAKPRTRARLGLCNIPEGRGIFPSLTVRENLRLLSPRKQEQEGIARILDAFPVLGGRLKQMAGTLSGGEQQMLAVSRAYASNPLVVLIDEVSLGLAPLAVDRIFDFLRNLLERGSSLVIVEQYVSRALALADTVYVLNRGMVVLSGPTKDLIEKDVFDLYLSTQVEKRTVGRA